MARSRRSAVVLALAAALAPGRAAGWGAAMHATLAARGHERMTARWKDAIDRDLLLYAAHGPDAWYLQTLPLLQGTCHVACGEPDGNLANECFRPYDPDRYYGFTRHLLANARSLAEASFALGYGAHQVGDYRGHLEYIIPGYRDIPGPLYSRHTLVDAAGDALVFNVDGLHGYPSRFTAPRELYGYAGFLDASNRDRTGGRDPAGGLVVEVAGEGAKRRVRWTWLLDRKRTLGSADAGALADRAALSYASEGVAAARHGLADDGANGRFPVVVRDGAVALACGNDWASRMEDDTETGWGFPLPCQIAIGTAAAGLPAWTALLRPADGTSDEIVPDSQAIAKWMSALAVEHLQGGRSLSDPAMFQVVDGRAQADFAGVDGQRYTQGRTPGEIVDGVLDRTVEDVRGRLLENPHVVGTLLQSRLPPADKARFLAFGAPVRPRLAAWPEQLEYESAMVQLVPARLASFDLPIDLRPTGRNAAPGMVFPWYLAEATFDVASMKGPGRLAVSVGWRGRDDTPLAGERVARVDLATAAVEGEGARVHARREEGLLRLRVVVDNTAGGRFVHPSSTAAAALVVRFALEPVDPSLPPFDLQAEATLQPSCEAPDPAAPGAPATDNAACPLPGWSPPDTGCGCAGAGPALPALLVPMLLRRRARPRRAGGRAPQALAPAALVLCALAPGVSAASVDVALTTDYRLHSMEGAAVDLFLAELSAAASVGRVALGLGQSLHGVGAGAQALQLGPVTTLRKADSRGRWRLGEASFQVGYGFAGAGASGVSVVAIGLLQVPLPGSPWSGGGADAFASLRIARPAAVGLDYFTLRVGTLHVGGDDVHDETLALGVSAGSAIAIGPRWALAGGLSADLLDESAAFSGYLGVARALGRDAAVIVGVQGGAEGGARYLGLTVKLSAELLGSRPRRG